MWLRALSFLLLQGLGAVLGVLIAPEELRVPGLLAGMLAGGWLWVLHDALRGLRVLGWLRADDLQDAPLRRGLWGQLAGRMNLAARRREQAGSESERRLQNILSAMQASPNGVMLLDGQGRIEWLNQTAASHFGLNLLRDRLQPLTHLIRDPAFVAYMGDPGAHGKPVVLPGYAHSADNPMRISVQLHDYGQGTGTGPGSGVRRLLLTRDITVFEQAEAMRRDFVANVSHEIRTPLTVLAGFIETLQSLDLSEAERKDYLNLMAQQSNRMQTLVNDLLMLSRLEGSPPPGEGEWTRLDAFMGSLEQEGRSLSALLHADQPQQLDFAPSPLLELSGVVAELHSAMSNLVSNAVRYTPGGGAVRCGWIAFEDGSLEFWVRDSGPGIAPEHIPRITERFYRVDRSRSRESGGTGLGLAIVKHVAQRHGAELRIASEPGKGSRFAIVFPAARVRRIQERGGQSA